MARGGRNGLRLALPLALCALAALPASALADPHRHAAPQFKFVSETIEVPAGQVVKHTVRCPAGFIHAAPNWDVQGGASVQLLGVAGDSVNYQVVNVFSTTPSTASLGALCVKRETKGGSQSKGDSHSHSIAQEMQSKPLVLPGQGETTVTSVPCSNGFSAVNGFLDADRRASLEQSMPSANGQSWDFAITNLTNEQQTNATASVQCVKNETGDPVRKKKSDCKKKKNRKKKRCRKHRHAVQRKVVKETVDVPSSPQPQESGVPVDGTAKCPTGFYPAGAGWSFPGHPFTTLTTFQPVLLTLSDSARAASGIGADFNFTIFNRSTEQMAEVQAVCLGEKTGSAG